MEGVRYEAPETLQAAVALLAGATGPARILAGGTDVIVQMETDLIEPALLVDIKKITETRQIYAENGGFRIGAAVPGMEIINHAAHLQGLAGRRRRREADRLDPDQGPRQYRRQSVQRLSGRRQRTGLGRGRRDRQHRRPEWHRARCRSRTFRSVPARPRSPKGEIVVSFFLPPRPPHSGDAYQRFTPRTEMDIAVVGVGVNLTLDDSGTCTAARVALGAVAPTVLLVKEAADALIGTRVDDAALDRLAKAASAACRPIDDKRGTKEYRIKVAGVLAKRTAQQALERARKN